VNERNIAGYFSGDWKIDKKLQNMITKKRISEKESKETLRKATAIQDEIVSKQLSGALRTVVRRSAFQRGGDQTLRFSLDTNLHIINEKVDKGKKWARDLNMPLRFDEVQTLPYAILEVKTQADAPSWVDELKNSGYIIPAPNFSKFLYGTCKLWPEKLDFTPPFWEMLNDIETTAPSTPALASIGEKISHFGSFAHTKAISLSPPAPEMNFAASPSVAKPEHRRVVERMYGSSSYLKEAPSNKDKGKKRDDLVTTKKTTKRIDTKTTLRRNQAKQVQKVAAGDPEIEVTKPLPKPPKAAKEFTPIPLQDMKEIKQEKEVKKEAESKRAPAAAAAGGGAGKNKKLQAAEQRAAKVYFANERTLLSWLNTATFLSLTGITLLTTETAIGRIAGVLLTAVTVLFAAYALFKYLKRLIGLRKRTDADVLDDKYGPIALIVCFCATLILVGVYYAVNGNGSL